MRIWESLLDFVFPRRCICCDQMIDTDDICADCIRDYSVKQSTQEHINKVPIYAPFHYMGSVKKGIVKFKFKGYKHYAKGFSFHMAEVLSAHCPDQSYQMIVYVPMPPVREKGRGYNQAKILAIAMSERLHIPISSGGLCRDSPVAQHNLSKGMRLKQNINSFYLLAEDCPPLPAHVLLVDDVYTSGNTIRACVNLLEQQGVSKITVITITKTE